MTTEDAFGRVLEKIYAVPLGDDLWLDALRSVSDLFGSQSAHFEIIDNQTCIPIFHKYDRPPSMQLNSDRLHNMGTSHFRGLRNGLKTIKLRRWS